MADQPFPGRDVPAPVSVEDIEILLFDPGPNNEEDTPQGGRYNAQLAMSDGSVEVRRGNLIPHLTAAEISGLQTLLARLRAKAEAAWIP